MNRHALFALLFGIAIGASSARWLIQNPQPSPPPPTLETHSMNTDEAPCAAPLSESRPAECPAVRPCPCLFSDEILPPPHFSSDLKEQLETNFEGEVRVSWISVPGAKRYEVFLEDPEGRTVKSYKTPRTALYLKDIPLPPGKFETDYRIRLASINGKDQTGSKGKPRGLHVKPQATVVAPQIQEIRIED